MSNGKAFLLLVIVYPVVFSFFASAIWTWLETL